MIPRDSLMSQAVPRKATRPAIRLRTFAALGVVLLGAIGLLLLLMVAASLPAARRALASTISSQLGVDATLEGLALSYLPRPHLTGTKLTLRLRQQAALPPFITVDRFVVGINPVSIFERRVDAVSLVGLHINVPPGDARADLPFSQSGDSRVLIGHLEAADSTLTILRRSANHAPLVFSLHDLQINDVGYDRTMRFAADLTNPVPLGLVTSSGTIGPWQRDNPARLPVNADYQLTHADLNTIAGISGTLTSTGHYAGYLNAINVTGTASVPDFSLDLGGSPVPLTATFRARVDATDGTTLLDDVDAVLIHSPIHATGAIRNLPGPGRHDVQLDVAITRGRIEDVLRLAIDAPTPVLVGNLALQAQLSLPPGPERARHRLRVTGHFGLGTARFTNAGVQGKVRELSRRSQGKDEDDPLGRVMTDLTGHFVLSHAVLSLHQLTFQVPGANVALAGTYALDGERLDLSGNLRMRATVSAAVGGFKSIFLKPFDFLFRKDGAGAVVPIAIAGTRKAPKMGVQFRKIF